MGDVVHFGTPQINPSGRLYEKRELGVKPNSPLELRYCLGWTYVLAFAKLSATCAQLTVFHHASM